MVWMEAELLVRNYITEGNKRKNGKNSKRSVSTLPAGIFPICLWPVCLVLR